QDAATNSLTTAPLATDPTELTTPLVTVTTDPPTTVATTTTTTAPKTTPKYKGVGTIPAPTSHAVPNVPLPPPPHQSTPGCAPTHSGNPAAKADVQSALVSAGSTQYWHGVQSPPMENGNTDPSGTPTPTGPAAQITLPSKLVEAIAWQESGWQSDITSCDGGVGTMQIMSATASWMNQRFGTSYDYKTVSGNAEIGSEYLEWLVAYFGENYFGYNYDLSDPDLLAAVIGAYNAGASNVTFANGHTVLGSYTRNVEALMNQQPWTTGS
ncbi:MAG TPA: transglycosylase SLT domain-containing protein, partial [Pseudonocardiaceae bacterium]|nr:transglycosylase SLT domain-containing protein [Pseudonocardiaceae bacterium]